MSSEVDVVVVGAGPAGSAAAAGLARRGRSVLLLDRAAFPREKACGDGLTRASIALLACLGVESEPARCQPILGTRLSFASGPESGHPVPVAAATPHGSRLWP